MNSSHKLSAIALALLLAACSSGDSTTDGGNITKDTASDTSTASGNTDTSSANTDTADTGATATQSDATAGSDLIDGNSIRGDVVAAALIQGATTADGAEPTAHALVPWTDWPQGQASPEPYKLPTVTSSYSISPSTDGGADGPYLLNIQAQSSSTWAAAPQGNGIEWEREYRNWPGYGFGDLNVQIPLSTNKAPTTADESLSVGKGVSGSTNPRAERNNQPAQFTAQQSTNGSQVLSSKMRVVNSKNSVINRWGQIGKDYQLTLSAATLDQPNRFQLCLLVTNDDHYLQGQTLCSLWQVPANWQPGQPLTRLGDSASVRYPRFVPEDASSQPANNHWATKDYNRFTTDQTITKTDAALSDKGISGAVLATLFLSNPSDNYDGLNSDRLRASAATSVDGDFISNPPAPATIAIAEDNSRGFPATLPTPDNFELSEGIHMHTIKTGVSTGPYAHAASRFWSTRVRLEVGLERDTSQARIFTLNRRALTELNSSEKPGLSPGHFDQTLTSDAERHVLLDELVAFGTVNEWKGSNDKGQPQSLTLSVQPKGDRQVEACWALQLQGSTTAIDVIYPELESNRTLCTLWNVPADWQFGKPLERQSYHVTDVSTGTNGQPVTRYWRSNPAATD